jgi:hypothetical protein
MSLYVWVCKYGWWYMSLVGGYAVPVQSAYLHSVCLCVCVGLSPWLCLYGICTCVGVPV